MPLPGHDAAPQRPRLLLPDHLAHQAAVTRYMLHRLLLRAAGVPMPDAHEIERFVNLWLDVAWRDQ
jgi:hypothetical protein